MKTLVLIRHGQSEWNRANRFTGWADVDLTDEGERQAQNAGQTLLQDGYSFDVVFTSLLKRAIRTMWLVMDEMDLMWLPVHRCWRLNERSYGALQGLNKAETAAQHSEEQVHIWRRSYDVPPPPLTEDDERNPGHDPRYASLSPEQRPLTECLKDTVERFLPAWNEQIAPALKADQRVLIVAHGNSLRALMMHLDGISEQDIPKVEIPTGRPLVYELDDDLTPIRHFYLGDAAEIEAEQRAVAEQGKKKS